MKAARVGGDAQRDFLGPEHGEVRRHHLAFGRQIQPDLEQLQRICLVLAQKWKHLGMHDAFASSEPLHVAAAKTRRGAQGVGVVDQAFAHDGHGFKAAVRVRRKARDFQAVVHRPAVFAFEILAQVAPGQRGVRPHLGIAAWVGIVVVDAEQERVDRCPRKSERRNTQNGFIGHKNCSFLLKSQSNWPLALVKYEFIAI